MQLVHIGCISEMTRSNELARSLECMGTSASNALYGSAKKGECQSVYV